MANPEFSVGVIWIKFEIIAKLPCRLYGLRAGFLRCLRVTTAVLSWKYVYMVKRFCCKRLEDMKSQRKSSKSTAKNWLYWVCECQSKRFHGTGNSITASRSYPRISSFSLYSWHMLFLSVAFTKRAVIPAYSSGLETATTLTVTCPDDGFLDLTAKLVQGTTMLSMSYFGSYPQLGQQHYPFSSSSIPDTVFHSWRVQSNLFVWNSIKVFLVSECRGTLTALGSRFCL